MKIRFEVESDQVAMSAPGRLVILLREEDYIEVETGKGWARRGAAALRDVWRRGYEAERKRQPAIWTPPQ